MEAGTGCWLAALLAWSLCSGEAPLRPHLTPETSAGHPCPRAGRGYWAWTSRQGLQACGSWGSLCHWLQVVPLSSFLDMRCCSSVRAEFRYQMEDQSHSQPICPSPRSHLASGEMTVSDCTWDSGTRKSGRRVTFFIKIVQLANGCHSPLSHFAF